MKKLLLVTIVTVLLSTQAYAHKCDSAWNGSSNDGQLEAHCKAACAYQGSNQQGYEYSCMVLGNFGDDAVSSCPVCTEGFQSDSSNDYKDDYSDDDYLEDDGTGCFINSIGF